MLDQKDKDHWLGKAFTAYLIMYRFLLEVIREVTNVLVTQLGSTTDRTISQNSLFRSLGRMGKEKHETFQMEHGAITASDSVGTRDAIFTYTKKHFKPLEADREISICYILTWLFSSFSRIFRREVIYFFLKREEEEQGLPKRISTRRSIISNRLRI